MAIYHSCKAFRTLLKASLISLLRTPSYLIFNIAFPLLIITAARYISLPYPANASLHIITSPEFKDTALLNKLRNNPLLTLYEQEKIPPCDAMLQLSDTLHITYLNTDKKQRTLLYNAIFAANALHHIPLSIKQTPVLPYNNYHNASLLLRIIGFIIFFSSVFGTAFTFFHLKNNNVFKLIRTTPIPRMGILSAELFSRFLFTGLSSLSVFFIGMIILSLSPSFHWVICIKAICFFLLGTLSFMPYGLLVGILARSITAVPMMGNIIAIPQWALTLLSPNTHLPSCLEQISLLLPFPQYNHALQSILSESATPGSLFTHTAVLALWGGIGYLLCYKTFKRYA